MGGDLVVEIVIIVKWWKLIYIAPKYYHSKPKTKISQQPIIPPMVSTIDLGISLLQFHSLLQLNYILSWKNVSGGRVESLEVINHLRQIIKFAEVGALVVKWVSRWPAGNSKYEQHPWP